MIDLGPLKFAPSAVKPKATRGRTAGDPADNPFWAAFNASIDNGERKNGRWEGAAQTVTLPNDDDVTLKAARVLVGRAAAHSSHGYRFRSQGATVTFWAMEPPTPGDQAECPVCHKDVRITGSDKLATHGPRDSRCGGSGLEVESDDNS